MDIATSVSVTSSVMTSTKTSDLTQKAMTSTRFAQMDRRDMHVSMEVLEMCLKLLTSLVQHLLERHILDVMHCEKNLCENLLKTLFGMNDSPGSRVDAEDLGIRQEIWLQPPRRQQDGYYMPHVPYVFRPHERAEFVGIVSNIRTPTNYVGSIHKRLADGKLQYMKMHDYHVLMQQASQD